MADGMQSVKVKFEAPKVQNKTCGDVTVTQVMGAPSGSLFEEGRHLIMYKVTGSTGYERDIGFYVNVKQKVRQAAVQPSKPTTPENTMDTEIAAISGYRPKDLGSRESIESEMIEVDSNNLRFIVYDNATYDGDTVSIFLNEKAVVIRQEVNITGREYFMTIDPSIE
jgi:hypothetical protein